MAYSQVQTVQTPSENAAEKGLKSIAKHFCVSCICGDEMTIKHTMTAYHSSVAWCDGCKKSMDKEEYSFHCLKRGTSSLHSSGFDYCFGCALKKYHQQNDDKLNDELDIILNNKYNNITDKNVNKLINELCLLQTKQLNIIQCLNTMIVSNDNENDEKKQNDNNNNEMNEFVKLKKLELSQSILYENINLLQTMMNTQKTAGSISLNLLNKHYKLISNWQQWNVSDVIHWIISVDNGIYKEYETEITHGVTKENVRGKSLIYVDSNCLLRWKIFDIEKRNNLLLTIKSLINQTETDQTDEGK